MLKYKIDIMDRIAWLFGLSTLAGLLGSSGYLLLR
jgi:hypothetical protein